MKGERFNGRKEEKKIERKDGRKEGRKLERKVEGTTHSKERTA